MSDYFKTVEMPLKPEKILITGGAGYLGSVLVQKLMESKKSYRLSINDRFIEEKALTPSYYFWDKVTVYDNLMSVKLH